MHNSPGSIGRSTLQKLTCLKLQVEKGLAHTTCVLFFDNARRRVSDLNLNKIMVAYDSPEQTTAACVEIMDPIFYPRSN